MTTIQVKNGAAYSSGMRLVIVLELALRVLGQGRLVLTPHCAWYSEEVEADIAREAIETCLRWQRGEPLPNALNAYHAC